MASKILNTTTSLGMPASSVTPAPGDGGFVLNSEPCTEAPRSLDGPGLR